jgi:GTP-binding protein
MKFVDLAEVEVIAGDGGDGIVAFRREKYVPAGGPSGGNGGNGGSVYLVADTNLQTLLDFRYAHQFKAAPGQRGGPNNRTGATGLDREVAVPCGTAIYDADTDVLLGDLITAGQALCVAKGGKGGLGQSPFPEQPQPRPRTCPARSAGGNPPHSFRTEAAGGGGHHRPA